MTVFSSAASRGSTVIKGRLGADSAGVVGSDRSAGYAWRNAAFRPLCWAHLLRDCTGLVDRGGTAKPVGSAALALSHTVVARWPQFREGTRDRAGRPAAMLPVQDAFGAVLTQGIQGDAPRAATRCTALHHWWPALWPFVDEEDVEPTNNAAERARRPAVLWRKGSYGSQSEGGTRFVARLLTVTATCHQHGRSGLAYLTAVCTAAHLGLPVPARLPAPP